MSKLGKILLYVAFAGAIAAAVAGGLLINKHAGDAVTLKQVQDQVSTAQQAAKKAEAEAADLKQANADTTSKLADVTSKVDDLNTQLTAAKKSASDAQNAEQTANDAAAAAQKKLDDFTATLKGQTPDELVQAAKKAQDDLTAAQAEQKIMQDQYQAAQDQIAKLMADINNEKSHTMPGVSGKVTFVDHAWNFVILDVGLSAGVVPNGELIVYRGRNFLGKVRVTKVDPNDSVAEILPDAKGDIQIGDAVLN